MMKKLILFGFIILTSTSVFADMMGNVGFGDGYGMMYGSGVFGMGLFGLIYLVLISFIFSVIFWLTYNWLVKKR